VNRDSIPRSIKAASSGKISIVCSFMVRCSEMLFPTDMGVHRVLVRIVSHQFNARCTALILFLSIRTEDFRSPKGVL